MTRRKVSPAPDSASQSQGELPDRLEHPEAIARRRPAGGAGSCRAATRACRGRRRRPLGGLERAAAAEDGEPREEDALGVRRGGGSDQAIVAFSVAWRRVGVAWSEQVEPLAEALGSARASSSFTRAAASSSASGSRSSRSQSCVDRGASGHVGAHRAGPRDEQLDAGVVRRVAADRVLVSAPIRSASRLVTSSRNDGAASASAASGAAAAGRSCSTLSSTTCVRLSAACRRSTRRRPLGAEASPGPGRRGLGREAVRAATKTVPPSASSASNRRELDREARLAGAAGADDGEHARIALENQPDRVEQLPLPADERRGGVGQGDAARRAERRELARRRAGRAASRRRSP